MKKEKKRFNRYNVNKKIKNRHVLIVGSGSSLETYWPKIKKFIKKHKAITVGCNNVTKILVPDYHFWTDRRRYRKYGKNIDEKSILIFGNHINKKIINKNCNNSYQIIKYSKQKWKKSYDDVNSHKYGWGEASYDKVTNTFHGVFRAVGSLAILWAYVNKAKYISVVGMDGYTLYSKEELDKNKESQHCYGKGFTDVVANAHGTKKYDKFYKFCKKKDEDIYKTLKSINKYGVKFKILTPTVYKEFYDNTIFEI